MKRLIIRGLKWGSWGILLIIAILFFSDFLIRQSARDRVFSEVEEVRCVDVALVLGASKTLGGGRTNLFFKYRIEAAAELYKAGKVRHFILSGDNHIASYDEPSDMKEALIQLGVPAHAITLDYAGFRTLDSIVRAKKVFGQEKILVISQRFHNERALFIAKANGIEASGYNAKDVNRRYAPKTYLREYPARVKAMLDLYILGVQPKFLGESVPIYISTPCEN